MFIVLVASAMFLAGGTLCVVGWRRYIRSRDWPETTATVMSVRGSSDGAAVDTSQTPTVRFEVAGEVVHGLSRASDNLHSYRPGQQVPVRYDPACPQRFVVDRVGQNGFLLGILGGFVGLVGGAVLVLIARSG